MVHRPGMVEKAGSGIKRMRKSMEEYDLELVFEIGSFLSAVFHRNVQCRLDTHPTKTGSCCIDYPAENSS
jgi:predicted HTH transcriptional regulator